MFQLFTDGGSRGNPGKSGAGAVLKLDGKVIAEANYSLLVATTNNAAEYHSLILGLRLVPDEVQAIEIFMDSSLVVNQVNGKWKVNAEHLRPLRAKAVSALKRFRDRWSLSHVRRAFNKDADHQANLAMDRL